MRTTLVLLGSSLVLVGGLACGGKSARKHEQIAMKDVAANQARAPAGKDQLNLPRKIIYTVLINLVVDDFTKAEAALKLGQLEKTTTDAQDVTEEYYDLDARIRIMKKEEERLLGHLEKSTGKLDDILKVEHELTRVREVIERHQGRQNLLARLTAMTTVTIMIHERSSYVPEEAVSFGSAIAHTFGDSWTALVDFAKGLVVVALAPWLLPLSVLGVPCWVMVRRRRSRLYVAKLVEETPPASES